MSLDEVTAATTIEFTRPLEGRSPVEDLFCYFWREGKIETHYEVIERYVTGGLYQESPPPTDARKVGSCVIKGDVKDARTFATSYFEVQAKSVYDEVDADLDKERTFFSGMKFDTVLGWDLAEYRPDVTALWATTRQLVEKYFSERPGSSGERNELNLF
ncbi:MAG: hypothetical protein AABX37_04665 [Nanoarchaeota archaeon]